MINEQIAITEVKIKVSDTKTIELTVEEAKALLTVLQNMFGAQVIKEEHHHHHYQWWYYPPVTIDPTPAYPFQPYITCDTGTLTIDANAFGDTLHL